MEERKNNSKNIILVVFGVLILICSVLAVGFAVFVFNGMSSNINSITTGTLSFSYNEVSNGIEIVNAIPIDDSVGKILTKTNSIEGVKQGFFDFSISSKVENNVNMKYEIYATLMDDSDMDNNYIKVYLTDDSDKAYNGYNKSIPVYSELEDYKEVKNSKLLYTDIVDSNKTTKNFRLRLWVDKRYTDGSSSKKFKIKINVKATA